MDVLAGGINGQGVGGELFAQHYGQPFAQRIKQVAGFRVGAEGDTPAAPAGHVPQGKAHGRFCHGQPFDHVEDRLSLGPFGAQEFQARGRGIKQITQGDGCAGAARCGARRVLMPPFGANFGGIMAFGLGFDAQPPDSRKGCQRLSTKPKGADVQQVRPIDLGGRVAGQSEGQLLRRNATAIIRDLDQRLAPVGLKDFDPRSACIDGIFHKLFHR